MKEGEKNTPVEGGLEDGQHTSPAKLYQKLMVMANESARTREGEERREGDLELAGGEVGEGMPWTGCLGESHGDRSVSRPSYGVVTVSCVVKP